MALLPTRQRDQVFFIIAVLALGLAFVYYQYAFSPKQEALANPPPVRATEAQIAAGAQLFAETCAVCHGQNAVGGVKDLRHMTPDTHARFNAIVLEGLYLEKGMASFADILTPEQVEQIHHYLIARANEDWGER